MSTYVRLRVAAEAYAMPVAHVREIADVGTVTPVPGLRREVLGVRNLRGQILLRIARTVAPARLLVAEAGGLAAGLAIDVVSGVGEMPEPTDESDSDLLSGAVLDGSDLIGVIDVPGVFAELERAQR